MPAAELTARKHSPARRHALVWAVVVLALLLALHLLALHQGIRWTSPLLLGDHLFDLASAVATLWYALALGRRVGAPLLGLSRDPLTENLIALALGLGILSTAILCAGFLRLYHGPVFVAAWLALTAWLWNDFGGIAAGAWQGTRSWLKASMPAAPTLGQRIALLTLVIALVLVVIRALDPVNSDDVNWDALAYHMSGAQVYVMHHEFVPLPDMPLANGPSGVEMLYIPAFIAGVDSIGASLGLCSALLLYLATFALARRHFGRRTARLALLLLCANIWQPIYAPEAQTDCASAFAILLALGDAMAWLSQNPGTAVPVPCHATAVAGPGQPAAAAERCHATAVEGSRTAVAGSYRLLIRSGLLAGLGVSFRLTNLPAIIALLAMVAAGSLLFLGGTSKQRAARTASAPLLFGVAALLPLSPWLLKNMFFFGRPFWPVSLSTAAPVSNGFAAASSGSESWLAHAWWVVTTQVHLYLTYGSWACVLLLAAPLLLFRQAGRSLVLFVLVGGVLWLTFVPTDTPRYYFVPIVAAIVLTAATVEPISHLLNLPRNIVEICTSAYLIADAAWALVVAAILAAYELNASAALGTTSTFSYLAPLVRPYQAEVFVDESTPPRSVVAMVGVSRPFYLDRTTWATGMAWIQHTWATSTARPGCPGLKVTPPTAGVSSLPGAGPACATQYSTAVMTRWITSA